MSFFPQPYLPSPKWTRALLTGLCRRQPALLGGLLLAMATGCQPTPEASGWEGRYCLRWSEELHNGQTVSEYLNTCDGAHEQIELYREGHRLRMAGAEGRRPLQERDAWAADAEGLLDACGDSVVVAYRLRRQGEQVLLEKTWTHDGEQVLIRRSYTR